MKKLSLLLTLFFIVLSCQKDKKENTADKPQRFTTQEVTYDASDLSVCEGEECPHIKVSYVEIQGEKEFARPINENNSKEIIRLLYINEEEEQPATIADAASHFAREALNFTRSFPESAAAYEAKVEQEIKSRNDKTIVFETSYYLFTGGAHGYGGMRFLNYDAHTGKLLTHSDLISDIPAFTDFVEQKFRTEYQIPEGENINSTRFFFDDDKFVLPENIAVTDQQVILVYNPYEVSSYADGQLRFVFPKKTVEKWFKY